MKEPRLHFSDAPVSISPRFFATAKKRQMARCIYAKISYPMNPDDTVRGELVTALFRTRDAADAAAGDLMTSGFHADEIRLITQETADEMRGAEGSGKTLPVDDVVPAITPSAGPAGVEPATGFGGGYPLTADSGPGGVMAAVAMLRLSDDHALYVSDEVRGGRTLIAVRAGPRAAIARTILERNGGETSPATS